ncbi:hypothetical protein PBY51_023559 [Eleginops maclovinus]|uniref:Uncharacterized protein n=1 Tax=Eleginops maclovinus TaxID=56733 RepID=A0AAN7X383_ELEMC|nr:hypothetical protein PBY51_023559 [Eleginops maclovinus]
MEVWRHQRHNYSSAKVYCSGFHVRAMNKYANRGDGNEELGDCKHQGGLPERVVGLWPAELTRFLCTSLIEVPLVRVPQGKKLRKIRKFETN